MDEVHEVEQELLHEKETIKTENIDKVEDDVADQNLSHNTEIQVLQDALYNQNLIYKALNEGQDKVVDKMVKKSQDLEQEREGLQQEKDQLLFTIDESKKSVEELKGYNGKVKNHI